MVAYAIQYFSFLYLYVHVVNMGGEHGIIWLGKYCLREIFADFRFNHIECSYEFHVIWVIASQIISSQSQTTYATMVNIFFIGIRFSIITVTVIPNRIIRF